MAASTISLHFHLFPSSPSLYFPQSNDEYLFYQKGKSRVLWKLLKKKKKMAEASQAIRAAGFAAGMISVEKKKMTGREEGLVSVFKSLVEQINGALHYFRARSFRWYLNPQVLLEKFVKVMRMVLQVIMNCRFFTLIGVVGSLVGSVLCFIEGCFLILKSYFEYFFIIWKGLDQGDVLQLILEASDMFLVGTAMLVFGMGLYSMFIEDSEIPRRRKGLLANRSNLFGLFHLQMLPAWMQMKSVAEAKSRIGHAVMMLLQAGMVEKLKGVSVVNGMDLGCFAAAIFTASATVFLLAHLHSNRTKLKNDNIRI
ncbi:uncharacterized protein LOC110098386 [Dendrobium catenatum]|uniref:uncharacterized protein LOC110098386 n=1 Tax=Dendrobium catenatum TaxID=906689 RepID=UPI00109F411E|nr:uncharacterized protein LOC110098386 [Dendrobium catenatum]